MNQELGCEIVRDLLPNYIDQVTSDETNDSIEYHLSHCRECNRIFQQMKEGGELDTVADTAPFVEEETRQLRKFLKKTKIVYVLQGILVASGILGILITGLIDFVINHRFTWSLIVISSIIFVYIIGITFISSNNNKVLKTLEVITVGIFPFLWTLSFVTTQRMEVGVTKWFLPYGAPLAITWLVVCWGGVAAWKLSQNNIFMGIAVLLFLSVLGELSTAIITSAQRNITELQLDVGINCICCAIVGIIFLILSRKYAKFRIEKQNKSY